MAGVLFQQRGENLTLEWDEYPFQCVANGNVNLTYYTLLVLYQLDRLSAVLFEDG